MRNIVLVLLACASVVVSISCSNKQIIRQTLRRFEKTTIYFPSYMLVSRGGKMELSPVPEGFKYVIYISPKDCSTCEISHLAENEVIFNLGNKYNFNTLIIVSPSDESLEQTEWLIASRESDFPIWYDKDFSFRINNKGAIPEDKRFHRFLVNPDGVPVLIGNLQNVKIQELLRQFFEMGHNNLPL